MSVPAGMALAAVEPASGDATHEEKVLLARARARDRIAFEALVRQHAELRTQLERAVRRLPEDYRAAVVLRDIEGLSTTEAAEALGLREAAFKSRLHRGRLALRQELSEYLTE